jgi:hypothetical protein
MVFGCMVIGRWDRLVDLIATWLKEKSKILHWLGQKDGAWSLESGLGKRGTCRFGYLGKSIEIDFIENDLACNAPFIVGLSCILTHLEVKYRLVTHHALLLQAPTSSEPPSTP